MFTNRGLRWMLHELQWSATPLFTPFSVVSGRYNYSKSPAPGGQLLGLPPVASSELASCLRKRTASIWREKCFGCHLHVSELGWTHFVCAKSESKLWVFGAKYASIYVSEPVVFLPRLATLTDDRHLRWMLYWKRSPPDCFILCQELRSSFGIHPAFCDSYFANKCSPAWLWNW